MKYLEKGDWRLHCSSEEVSQKDYEHSIVVTYKDDIIGTMSIFNKNKKNSTTYWINSHELYHCANYKSIKEALTMRQWEEMIAELDKQKEQ